MASGTIENPIHAMDQVIFLNELVGTFYLVMVEKLKIDYTNGSEPKPCLGQCHFFFNPLGHARFSVKKNPIFIFKKANLIAKIGFYIAIRNI